MATSSSATTTDSVDLLLAPVDGDWVASFRFRGRVWRMVPGGVSTSWADGSFTFRVWNAAGRMTDVTIRPRSVVEVLTYAGSGGWSEWAVAERYPSDT